MPIEVPIDKWPGAVRTVTIGATAPEGGSRARAVTVGGEKSLPFMHFESEMPHPPVIAVEIKDRRPEDWSPLLLQAWGDVVDEPGRWAKAAESSGADLIQLSLTLTDKDGQPTTPKGATAAVKAGTGVTPTSFTESGPGKGAWVTGVATEGVPRPTGQ